MMEIWFDGANPAQITDLANQGWITGVTTNPKILSSRPIDVTSQIQALLACQTGPLAVQITARDEQGMITQAQRLQALNKRIIVKVPVTTVGLKVIPALVNANIPTLATAVFNTEQFLLAAKMGVQYVAPYLSQMNRHGIDAFSEITLMQSIKNQYHFKTKLMIASIQDIRDVTKAASIGINAATLSPACLNLWLSGHELTQKFTEMFEEHFSPFARQYAGDLFVPDDVKVP